MRTGFTLFLAILAIGFSNAQNSNAIFFSENGERFTVIINGLQQNDNPETNVKVTGLKPTAYKTRILFDNKNLGYIEKNIFLEESQEVTYVIKKKTENGKVRYFLRGFSMTDIPIAKSKPQHTGGSTTTTTTHTTTVKPPPPGSQVTVSFNVGGIGGNMGIDMNMFESTYHESTTYTTTTTTTTTSGGGGAAPRDHFLMPGYNGPIGCDWPMTEKDFAKAKESIASKSFDDSRLTIAKQIINSNCLLSKQVKDLMMLLSFEGSRLDLAKYAYGYTYDTGNYYKVNDAFTFESSIEDLNKFIEDQR